MSDIFETLNQDAKEQNTLQCRVAYTLNNTQPVACTIIGEQPLFYMDYEDISEESDSIFDDPAFAEEFFTQGDLDLLKEEIGQLKQQIESYEKFSSTFVHTSEEQLENFCENSKSFFEPESATLDLERSIEVLKQSRLATSYLEFAAEHNIRIETSTQIEAGEYNRKDGVIFINPSLDQTEGLLVLTQSLRQHWQHRKGALIEPLMFHPDQAVLINRAQVADLAVSIVRVAWELQLSGYKEAWERIENSTMADLARAFAREAYLDFRTINNGEAAAAIFEAWFLSERCRAQDKILIQKMLSDTKGYVFDLEECMQTITPDLMAALGEMPYGKNYLANHVETIMNDGIFTDVRDRSNANFLWFIKFERSFRDVEDQMNGESSADHAQTVKDNEQKTTSADIISIYGGVPEAGGSSAHENSDSEAQSRRLKRKNPQQNTDGSGEVIYLRRWCSE